MSCPQCSRPNPIELEATNELRCWWCDKRWPAPAKVFMHKQNRWHDWSTWPMSVSAKVIDLHVEGHRLLYIYLPKKEVAVWGKQVTTPAGDVSIIHHRLTNNIAILCTVKDGRQDSFEVWL